MLTDEQIRNILGMHGALPLKDGATDSIIEGREAILIVAIRAILAAHSAGAQEPVVTLPAIGANQCTITPPQPMSQEPDCWEILTPNGSRLVPSEEAKVRRDAYPLYTHPQPMPQTDAARDAEDAKRYRFIKSQMKVGAVQTQLPLYRTLHWIGYEDCSDVHNADAAIDAEIERLDRAKGE